MTVSPAFAAMQAAINRASSGRMGTASSGENPDATALALGAAILRLDYQGVLVRGRGPDGKQLQMPKSACLQVCDGFRAIAEKIGMPASRFDELVEAHCRIIRGDNASVHLSEELRKAEHEAIAAAERVGP
jgi:hypothetical protein